MAFETIISDISKRGVATVTFNRPDRGNALSSKMIDEIVTHLGELAADEKVRALVIKANGKHFCGGADVTPKTDAAPPRFTLSDLFRDLDQFPKPTICVVNGGAIGAGAALAVCCDVTFAYPDAFFSAPEVRLGIVPGGVVPVLMRALGARNMRRYSLSGERVSGPEASRVGFAHEAHAAENMEAAVDNMVDSMLLGGPNAQKVTKEMIAAYDHPSVREPGHGQAKSSHHGIRTPEAQEGIAAFQEKRKPNWYVAR